MLSLCTLKSRAVLLTALTALTAISTFWSATAQRQFVFRCDLAG
jgi:hypothetical protein